MKTTPTIQPTDLDCAYLAGIIDGEGSISAAMTSTYDRRRPGGRYGIICLQLNVTNTDKRMIDWIAARWSGLTNRQRRSHVGQKDIWRFVATNRDMRPILRAAQPYLVIKREQAEIADELMRSMNPVGRHYAPEQRERRIKLALQLQDLNRKGTRPRGGRLYDGFFPPSSGDTAGVRPGGAPGGTDSASS